VLAHVLESARLAAVEAEAETPGSPLSLVERREQTIDLDRRSAVAAIQRETPPNGPRQHRPSSASPSFEAGSESDSGSARKRTPRWLFPRELDLGTELASVPGGQT